MTKPPDTPPPTPDVPSERAQPLTLLEHLQELRDRLRRAGISVLIGMAIGGFFVFGPVKLIDVLIISFARTDKPYAPLQAVGTAEQFTSYMMVALAVGIIVAMPMIVYQIIAFIAPGLMEHEKRFVVRALPFVTGFFLAGIAFGWFVTVPVAIRFLIGFGGSELIASQPTLSDFLRTVSMLLLVNGVVFELPVVIYVLAILGFVTSEQLGQYRHYAVLIIAIVAAVITPTGDPVNMLLLAVPMYLLYELGIIVARFVPNRDSSE